MNSFGHIFAEKMQYEYLNWEQLVGYRSITGNGFISIAISKDGIKFFLDELQKKYNIKDIENDALIICCNCLGNFLQKNEICNCYDKLLQFENYIICVKSQELQGIPEILKSVKNKVKSVRSLKKRAQRELDADGAYSENDIEKLFEIQNGRCFYCMCNLHSNSQRKFSIDHLVPLFKGGSNWPLNLVLSCKSCNSRKSWKEESQFIRDIRSDKPTEWKKENQKHIRRIRRQKEKHFNL